MRKRKNDSIGVSMFEGWLELWWGKMKILLACVMQSQHVSYLLVIVRHQMNSEGPPD